jgi:phosphoribosylcarboxyaminoimidazole (NCAIR) mutase
MTQSPTVRLLTEANAATDAANPATPLGAALNATYVGLIQAAKNPDLLIAGAVTLDGSDQVTSAVVQWPDGSPGTLTITSRDANGAVLAYNITYGSPVTKTFTQPTITRNANGAATNVPQIVVS